MFPAENKTLWALVGLLALTVGILVWLFLSSEPFKLIVLFDHVGNLKEGSPVLWRDFTIGKVTEIRPLVDNQFGVTIQIREDYAHQITRGTEFYLKPAPLLGLMGNDAIEVITGATLGPPLSPGEKVQGKRREVPSILEAGKQWTLESWQKLKDQTNALLDAYQNSPYRQEVEEAIARLKRISEEGAAQAKGRAEDFRQRHRKELEEIRRKLEDLRDKMRAKGNESDARRIDDHLKKIDD